MITPLLVSKAYAAVQAQVQEDQAATSGATPPGGPNFSDILKSVVGDTVQASKAAETQMVNGIQGKADLVDVVTAISSAEASLQTVMAVRDQVIGAYQQIMAMQI